MTRAPFDGPYCLVHSRGQTHLATGSLVRTRWLAEVPRPRELPTISLVPFCQLRERGFAVHDGGEEILSLVAHDYAPFDLDALVADGAERRLRLRREPRFDPDDATFDALVARVIADEICQGEGSNFLLSRKCRLGLADFGADVANTVFARLARNEFGAYMTFCFFDGERYFVGSSPERHITIDGRARMNPICGTLPKAGLGSRAQLLEFLADPKEIHELFQVVDEELKMLCRICAAGGTVSGPYLKEMSCLVHTEYELEGRATLPLLDAFRQSMFAATMVGSPLENAARIIHAYETESRRYYSGALLLLTRTPDGEERLDSAITIRTMEVDLAGEATIQTGASIVRDSVPSSECRETRAKAEGLLRAILSGEATAPVLHRYLDDGVRRALASRNEGLSRFWMQEQPASLAEPPFLGKSALIVDNEDEFTYMLRHVLVHLGLRVDVRPWRESGVDGHEGVEGDADVVIIGPGPGNPQNLGDPKIQRVHALTQHLLDSERPFLAVCLGHQVLCSRLGLRIVAVDPPLQGVQRSISLFGREETVGFYNTFFALAPEGGLPAPEGGLPAVEIAAERSGHVMALRAKHFASFQFHVESILTTNGVALLQAALERVFT